MNYKISSVLLIALILVLALNTGFLGAAAQEASPQVALGTGFTYQGYLEEASGPVDGNCSFKFTLYGSATGTDKIGNTLAKNSVGIDQGYFNVSLDLRPCSLREDPMV